MRVRHVRVRNFRGIKQLDWSSDSRFVVLVGLGDSGKTAFLDAIALALSPRWNPSITDASFYLGDTSNSIRIEVTVSECPPALTREDRFGHWIRGISPTGALHDEPEQPADDEALTIRLEIDSALEPSWHVIRDREDDGVPISASSRALLGAFRLGDAAASHLRWTPESALTRLADAGEVNTILVEAHRAARRAVFGTSSPGLTAGAEAAGKAVQDIGGARLADPRPGLDPASGARSGSLLLHDGDIPATSLGTGSQRLAGVAFQLAANASESIVLIDEIEIGLEPHRLLHLIRHLRGRAERGTGQMIITTHSPIVVEGIDVTALHIVRRTAGGVTVNQVPRELDGLGVDNPQATARSGASAMLARRIVVCEGKTEVGVCRALFRKWDEEEATPAALLGSAYRDGGGSRAPGRAECLSRLGYPTALIHDADLKPDDQQAYNERLGRAVAAGVRELSWRTGFAIEDQVAASIPIDQLATLIGLAVELNESDDPEQSVQTAVRARLPGGSTLEGLDPSAWARAVVGGLPAIRTAIGQAARMKGWFKSEASGERLGEVINECLPSLETEDDLRRSVERLRSFVYDRDASSETA